MNLFELFEDNYGIFISDSDKLSIYFIFLLSFSLFFISLYLIFLYFFN